MFATKALLNGKVTISEEQHALLHSAFLHLAPGALIMLFYLATVSGVMARGLPPMFAMLLAILFVAVPVELGDLLRRGKARNGRLSLQGLIAYRRPMPVWQYVTFTLGFLIVALFASGGASLLDAALGNFFSRWLPEWFFLNRLEAYSGYTRTALQWTLVLNLVLNCTAAPIVEELYFRGFLLPRLSRLGFWAPIVNALLFTVYHFWQPYAYASIFPLMTLLAWLVWRKQNVYLGIVLHISLNTVGNLILFAGLLGQ